MSTRTLPARVLVSRPPLRTHERLCLSDVSWQDYERLGEIFRDRPNLRMTYDRGELEFMTLSNQHEFYKRILSRAVETLLDECEINFYAAGSMTFKREDLRHGAEPDECYWIANEPVMRGRVDYDPTRDPPPDLLVEIEVSQSILDRLDIFAALGVPEIWRLEEDKVTVWRLQPEIAYSKSAESPIFPGIPISELSSFIGSDPTRTSVRWLHEFRQWAARFREEPS